MSLSLNELIDLAKTYEEALPPFPKNGRVESGPMAQRIDHTLLKPEATPTQVRVLCRDAVQYEFSTVCVNPLYVKSAVRDLAGSPVKVCTVVGFPLGAVPTRTKVLETNLAIRQGAAEIDMVIPIGMLKGGQARKVLADVSGVVDAAHARGAIVKVILEMALLSRYEKILGCLISRTVEADFVKTSTGFGPGGATVEDVELMRRVVGPVDCMGVKAAGGIRTLSDALAMLQAGANRLGTSSGVKLVQESEGAYEH
jgi:deoxyribose-phosphate aldolase